MSAAPSCHAPADRPAPGAARVVVVGNPNAGKSTLFNALTGGGAQVGNYAGTTVDRLTASADLAGFGIVNFTDVPGTYSLAARSPEERIAIDSLLGLHGEPAPHVALVVLDAPRLSRSLYLALQVLDLDVPVVIALNLMDEARALGVAPDVDALAAAVGVPVIPVVGRSGEGVPALREALAAALRDPVPAPPVHDWPPAVLEDAAEIAVVLPASLAPGRSVNRDRALAIWLLLSVDDDDALPAADVPAEALRRVRARAKAAGRDLAQELVGRRYHWIDAHPIVRARRGPSPSDQVDRVLLHPIAGGLVFLAVMVAVFLALFSWSDPAVGLIEAGFGVAGDLVRAGFDGLAAQAPAAAAPIGIARDLVVDGVIGGVGAVLVFIPQIALLFLFLGLLEDCGYLARAASWMDRALRFAGLPGKAFVPLLSGFACAVPAILATRTLPRARDRLVTMAVIPLTSCSARLPVYTLLVRAVFPEHLPGSAIPVRPLALLGVYLLASVATVLAAIVVGRMLPEDTVPDVLELPPYRRPSLRAVGRLVVNRVADFLREAGRVILVATLVLWALLSFPRYDTDALVPPAEAARIEADGGDPAAVAAGRAVEASFGGRLGKALEPVVAPLGFDWRTAVGLVGAFAAREVFVTTLGVVYGLGDVSDDDTSLEARLRAETGPDGLPRWGVARGAALMVWFVFAFQCLSTFAVLKRESGGWRLPVLSTLALLAAAWVASALVWQIGSRLG